MVAYINQQAFAEKHLVNKELEMRAKIGQGNRKFASKLKSPDKKSFMGPYGEIIPEHSQFEHSKHRIEIWNDIFKHTDRVIARNQETIINLYNKDPRLNLDIDQSQVKKITDKNIAYPLNYKPSKSFLEEYIN